MVTKIKTTALVTFKKPFNDERGELIVELFLLWLR